MKLYEELRGLIAESKIVDAFNQLESEMPNYVNEELKNSFILIKARATKLEKDKLNGLKVTIEDENKVAHDLLNIVSLMEKNEDTNFSLEDISKAIKIFSKKSIEIDENSNVNSLHEIYNLRLRLHDKIFKDFDEKIEKQSSKLLFERILAVESLNQTDIDLINRIKKNKSIKWYEKTTIVYALSISLIKDFSIIKVNLLIDFISEHEEYVWDIALSGLFLGLYNRQRRLNFFPDTKKRISRLFEFIDIKESLAVLSYIFETELYKFSIIPFGKYNVTQLQNSMLEMLETLTSSKKSGIDLSIGNRVNLHNKEIPFSKEPYKWFVPFFKQNETLVKTINEAKTDINPDELVEILESQLFLSDIEKYNFCLNLQYDNKLENFIPILNIALSTCNEVFSKNSDIVSEHNFDRYTSILKNVYMFLFYFPKENLDLNLNEKLSIYNSSLYSILSKEDKSLELIANTNLIENEYFHEFISTYFTNITKYLQDRGGTTPIKSITTEGVIEFQKGNYQSAKIIFESIIKNNTNVIKIIPATIGLAHIELCLGNEEKAIEYYVDAKNKFPTKGVFEMVFINDYQLYLKEKGINQNYMEKIINKVKNSD